MKKILFAIATTTLSMNTLASSYIELDLVHVSAEESINLLGRQLELDFDQQAIATHVGYNFNADSSLQHKAEVFIGFGINEDTVAGVDTNMRYYYGIAYRPTYKINEDWEVYARLSRAKTEVKFDEVSVTSDAETGWGLGLSYKNFTLAYNDIDNTQFINAGYTFKF